MSTTEERRKQQQQIQLLRLFQERKLTMGKALMFMTKGFCFRCGLRFTNDKTPDLYTIPQESIMEGLAYLTQLPESPENATIKHLASEAHKSASKKEICGSCMGLLQQLDHAEECAKIVKQIKDADLEFRDFYITISSPPSLMCRDLAMWCFIKDLPEAKIPANAKQEDYVIDYKDVIRWFYYQLFFKEFGVKFSHKSTFKIQITYTHDETKDEQKFLTSAQPSAKKSRHNTSGDSNGTVIGILREMGIDQFRRIADIPPKPVLTHPVSMVEVEHEPLHLAGYYIKHSRELAHTKWIYDGDRIGETSIEEIVTGEIAKVVQMKGFTFASAGREDINVRMMGRGRAFVIELNQPRNPFLTPQLLQELQDNINKSTELMEIHSLQIVPKDFHDKLKEAEESKTKSYRCIVHTSRAITNGDMDSLGAMKELIIQQKTPIRVLHRRAQCIRPKTIFSMNATYINSHFFMLDLRTQAGTYVKEFVHGDLGRTQPNIGSLLGCDADILQLDVLEVDFELPITNQP